MYVDIEKIQAVFKRNLPVLSVVIDPEEIPIIFDCVADILRLEVKAIEAEEPPAYACISRLEAAASEVSYFAMEIENVTG